MKKFTLLLTLASCCFIYSMEIPHAPQPAISAQGISCNICLEDKQKEELKNLSCGHSYCNNCLNHLVDNAIRERNIDNLKCPNTDCAREMNEQDIRNITNNNHIKINAYSDIAVLKWIAQQANARHCPTPNCTSVFINDAENKQSIVCAECNQRYCSNCLFNHEQTMSCKAAEAARAGDHAYQEWKRINTKECPHCHATIEKDGGCPTVSCFRCKHIFCWNCLGPYNHVAHDCRPVAPQVVNQPVAPLAAPRVKCLRLIMLLQLFKLG